MKRLSIAATVALLSVCLAGEVSARGGGGGGGGRPGGAGGSYRGGSPGNFRGGFDNGFRNDGPRDNGFQEGIGNRSNFDRTPAIGREDGGLIGRDGDRVPSADAMRHFLNLPGTDGAAGRGDAGAAQRALGADRIGDRSQIAGRTPDRIENKQLWNTDRQERSQQVNRQLANRTDDFRRWYGSDFWNQNPHDHFPFNQPWANWWNRPAWGALGAWCAWGSVAGVPYNYGDNVYYADGTVYDDNQVVGSADEYAAQAAQIAANVPQTDPQNVEWMPLGVFALTRDGQASGPEPTMFVQLAVSKEGIIAGTLQNTKTETVSSLEGTVDKKTQRAAWGIVGQKWPVTEAGIFNLTENNVPVLMHNGNGETQQWLMVRVEKPAGGADNQSSDAND